MPRRISVFEIGQLTGEGRKLPREGVHMSFTPRLLFELEMEEVGGYVASMGAAINVCNISVWECEGRRPLQRGSSSRKKRFPFYTWAGIARSL
jgi:hypothetical protein